VSDKSEKQVDEEEAAYMREMKERAEQMDSHREDKERDESNNIVGFGFNIERGDDDEEESKRGGAAVNSHKGSARHT
jgi:hypothetical protein